jgi:citrate lyase beta subunit
VSHPNSAHRRQPVHTVYGGAHLFTADLAQKLGARALQTLEEYAATPAALAHAAGLRPDLADSVYTRVVDKLQREPVEDFRIDFEDGFGSRPDEEEDAQARRAAVELANGVARGTLPAAIGIRIKALSDELRGRGLRTLDLFLTHYAETARAKLPTPFAITLPKIAEPAQVAALARACDALERDRGWDAGCLAIELMVETPQSVFAADGSVALPRLVAEGGGRVTAAHFGTYDYTASLAITAGHQHMMHPACDFAKHVMQVSLAGTSVCLSDGATNVMPVPPRRASGQRPTEAERLENTAAVHRAWRLQADHIRHSLVGGFYQGWDLHPAQLPIRFAAVYAFFLEGLEGAAERLRNFIAKAAQATLVGDVFDDAATGQGLLNYFLRAVNCGAITEQDAVAHSGLTLDELRSRSFLTILQGRRGQS